MTLRASHLVQVDDLNGDGKSDLIYRYENIRRWDSRIVVLLSGAAPQPPSPDEAAEPARKRGAGPPQR